MMASEKRGMMQVTSSELPLVTVSKVKNMDKSWIYTYSPETTLVHGNTTDIVYDHNNQTVK